MTRDFTLEKYSELIRVLKEYYSIMTVAEFLTGPVPHTHIAVLFHAVKKNPERAAAMALFEKRRRICSTYYFRWDPKAVNWAGTGESRFGNFPRQAIVEAKLYGHEVGYLPDGGDHVARLAVLEKQAPVQTSHTEAPGVPGGPWSPKFADFVRIEQSRKGWTVDGARSNMKAVLELLSSGKHARVMVSVEPEGWK